MNTSLRLSLTSFPCSSLVSTAHQDAATVRILFCLPPLNPLVPPCHQKLPVCCRRGAATDSALPVCRAAPLPRHTRLFPYVTGGELPHTWLLLYVMQLPSRHILSSSHMSRTSSCMSRLPSCNIFGPQHPPLHPFPLLHSPCTVALHYNR